MLSNSTTCFITYSDIKSKVQKTLSIIGKRLQDKQGSSMFSIPTLSSSEEDIMNQQIKKAVSTFIGNFSAFMSNYTENTSNISVTFAFNIKNANTNAFGGCFASYVIDFVIYELLSTVAPEFAKKYLDILNNLLNSAIKIAYGNMEPSVGTSSYNMVGYVFIEKSEKSDGYNAGAEGSENQDGDNAGAEGSENQDGDNAGAEGSENQDGDNK